jgi:membrane associated rhomboid family serine protease
LCIGLSFAVFQLDERVISESFAFSAVNLSEGRVWTLITALFIHSDITHLLGNMIFLYVFGNTLEDEIKSSRTLSIFFIGGIVSFLLSVFFYEINTPMVGASAGIFSLAAAVMLFKPLRFSLIFMMPLGLVALLYFIYNIFAVHYDFQGNIAYISHLIGFLTGIPFGIAWSKKWIKNLAIAFLLLIIYSIFQLYLLPEIMKIGILSN